MNKILKCKYCDVFCLSGHRVKCLIIAVLCMNPRQKSHKMNNQRKKVFLLRCEIYTHTVKFLLAERSVRGELLISESNTPQPAWFIYGSSTV